MPFFLQGVLSHIDKLRHDIDILIFNPDERSAVSKQACVEEIKLYTSLYNHLETYHSEDD